MSRNVKSMSPERKFERLKPLEWQMLFNDILKKTLPEVSFSVKVPSKSRVTVFVKAGDDVRTWADFVELETRIHWILEPYIYRSSDYDHSLPMEDQGRFFISVTVGKRMSLRLGPIRR